MLCGGTFFFRSTASRHCLLAPPLPPEAERLLRRLLRLRGCRQPRFGPAGRLHLIKHSGSSVLSLPLLCFQHRVVKRKMLPAPQLVQSDGLLTVGLSAAGEGWKLGMSNNIGQLYWPDISIIM